MAWKEERGITLGRGKTPIDLILCIENTDGNTPYKIKQNKTEQNSWNSVRLQGTNFIDATEIGCLSVHTIQSIWMRKEEDNPEDNTKKISRSPTNPWPTRTVTQKTGQETYRWKKMKMTHTQHGKICGAHGSEESVLCKWFHTLEDIQRFNATPLKIPTDFLRQVQPRIPKCVWKPKRTSRLSIHSSERSADFECPKLPATFQLDCKPNIIKTAWYWHTRHPHRPKEEKASSERKPSLFSQRKWEGPMGTR